MLFIVLAWTVEGGLQVDSTRTHSRIEKAFAEGKMTVEERRKAKRDVREMVRRLGQFGEAA